MPFHTPAEQKKNIASNSPAQDRSPAAQASAKLFGTMISPPSSFKDNIPSTLPVPELQSPVDRPQFRN